MSLIQGVPTLCTTVTTVTVRVWLTTLFCGCKQLTCTGIYIYEDLPGPSGTQWAWSGQRSVEVESVQNGTSHYIHVHAATRTKIDTSIHARNTIIQETQSSKAWY